MTLTGNNATDCMEQIKMTIEEMEEYIAEELEEQRAKMRRNEPNHYGYLYMIANDMGLIDYD